MALEKKELDNFLPNGFETLNQEGYKENFTEDKIQTGYEKDVPDLVSGPNLNNLIDKVGKNFNVLDGVNKYLNNMPIDSIPIVNSNNQLDYINKEEIGGASMPIGTIFAHTCTASFVPENSLPCDGTEYAQTQFQKFYTDWLVGKKLNTCTYEEYQQEISTYGKCAKFGLDTENGKFKVPTIPDGTYIQQAMTDDELGKSYNAGLPNIEGEFIARSFVDQSITGAGSGAFVQKTYPSNNTAQSYNTSNTSQGLTFDASLSNPIYGNSDTVQPNAVALRFFVVIATSAINQSEMDWSAWASGLEGKVNKSSSWGSPSNKFEDLSLKASGSTYEAPAKGWYCFRKGATINSQCNADVYDVDDTLLYTIGTSTAQNLSRGGLWIEVKKGYKVKITYDLKGTTEMFRFIYAEE